MHGTSSEMLIRELRAARNDSSSIIVVHYACESWFAVKDRPVGVSCVSFVDLGNGGDTTFSVTDRKDDAEKYVLQSTFEHLRQHGDARVLHWNMNTSDFGFQALENRYTYLLAEPPSGRPPQERLFDLDDLISGRYGKDYADHPKLINIARINGYRTRYFLSGKEEAEKFSKGEHGDIKRSVTEKAQILAFLTRRLLEGTLETKNAGPYVPFAGSALDSVQVALELGTRFLDVSRQLRQRHQNRPSLEVKDEYDAQDLYHSLLRVFFSDIREEEWTPSYAGSAARMDFLVPDYRLAIELKHSRSSMTGATLGTELIEDVAKYQKHPSVGHLVCLGSPAGGR